MDKLNIESLILISNNLIIKDIIKLFTINKKFKFIFQENYKIFSNNYFPMYNIVKNYDDFNDLLNINFNNILYINKNKLINYIKKNYWAFNFFKHKYINKNNEKYLFSKSIRSKRR